MECCLCNVSVPGLWSYGSHMKLVHCKDADFSLICGINNCEKALSSFAAFNTHIYWHHCEVLNLTRTSSRVEIEDSSDYTNVEPYRNDDQVLATFTNHDIQSGLQPSSSDHRNLDHTLESAKLLLLLSQQHYLSQSAVSDVIDGCQKHSMYVAECILSIIAEKIRSRGINSEIIGDVCSLTDIDIPQLFQDLDSTYLQEKFVKEII
uniref:C2H2-type domain-containing protein n=1 Tax=Amphimedon queenslandica TaxID=400682 RepID=A0A1X7TWL0_AMPQE